MQSAINLITVEEYLELEKTSEIRHEYLGGQLFPMSGASQEHNLITGNIITLLRPHLRGSSYRVFFSNMKLKVKLEKLDIFYYPDVLVTCNSNDNEKYFKTSPKLVVEVLSNSTQTIDRREKLFYYRMLKSLQEYVLISQDEVKVEIYRKDNQGNWLIQTLEKGDELHLNSIDLTLTMTDIYEDVIKII